MTTLTQSTLNVSLRLSVSKKDIFCQTDLMEWQKLEDGMKFRTIKRTLGHQNQVIHFISAHLYSNLKWK